MYRSIRDDINSVVEILKIFENEYLLLNNELRKNIYYKNRDRFNELKLSKDNSLELAA